VLGGRQPTMVWSFLFHFYLVLFVFKFFIELGITHNIHIILHSAYCILKKKFYARDAAASLMRPRHQCVMKKRKLNRESRWRVPGGVPMAQIVPRDRVTDASASHGNNGGDRVPHAAVCPNFWRKKGAQRIIVREWCWIGAGRTISITRPHRRRVRIIPFWSPVTRSHAPRDRVTQNLAK